MQVSEVEKKELEGIENSFSYINVGDFKGKGMEV